MGLRRIESIKIESIIPNSYTIFQEIPRKIAGKMVNSLIRYGQQDMIHVFEVDDFFVSLMDKQVFTRYIEADFKNIVCSIHPNMTKNQARLAFMSINLKKTFIDEVFLSDMITSIWDNTDLDSICKLTPLSSFEAKAYRSLSDFDWTILKQSDIDDDTHSVF